MRGRRVFAMVGTLLLGGLLVVPAQARDGRDGRHCAVRLQPVAPRDHRGVTRAALVDMGCYAAFSEALSAGSGGAIRVPADTMPAGLTQRQLQRFTSTAGAASVMIGTEYDGPAYLGGSQSYFAPTSCAGDDVWEVNFVGATWNDRFESGKGFGGCDNNRKFAAADFAGNSLLCTPNCASYGALANKVSSLRWRP